MEDGGKQHWVMASGRGWCCLLADCRVRRALCERLSGVEHSAGQLPLRAGNAVAIGVLAVLAHDQQPTTIVEHEAAGAHLHKTINRQADQRPLGAVRDGKGKTEAERQLETSNGSRGTGRKVPYHSTHEERMQVRAVVRAAAWCVAYAGNLSSRWGWSQHLSTTCLSFAWWNSKPLVAATAASADCSIGRRSTALFLPCDVEETRRLERERELQ
eukprot:6201877-Pleurochrysis_carterae.AAC.1